MRIIRTTLILFSLIIFLGFVDDFSEVKIEDIKYESTEIDTAYNRKEIDSLINVNIDKIRIINPNDTAYLKQIADYDKLVFNNWDLKIVKVKDITSQQVLFLYPLNPQTQIVRREKVSQILYADGRHEIFKPLIRHNESDSMFLKDVRIKDPKKWQKVTVVYNEDEIPMLFELGEVFAEYRSYKINASTEYLEKNAIIILKKKVANMNGTCVLVTEKKTRRPYGDSPFIRIEGRAFGEEDPKKEENTFSQYHN